MWGNGFSTPAYVPKGLAGRSTVGHTPVLVVTQLAREIHRT